MNSEVSGVGNADELPDPPPRMVRPKAARARVYGAYVTGYLLTGLAVGIGLGLPLLFFLIDGMRPPWLDTQLDRGGRSAEATIDSIERMEHTHINNQNPWKIVYHWTDSDGRRESGLGYLLDRDQGGLQPGDRLAIDYLPQATKVSRPTGGMAGVVPIWAYYLTIGLLIPELIGGVLCWRYARRQIAATHALLCHGTAVRAEVQGKRVLRFIRVNNRHPVDLDYRFHDEQGRPHTGRDRTYDVGWADHLKVGESIVVIFDPDFPDDNVIWPVTAK
ncbi:MAG: hypothetical protein QM518_06735 [Verrucomicrobiota bacterium]|jgi:hypothetical protein|nr:hypothetical protein [Verrucomicrobiota bacterium]